MDVFAHTVEVGDDVAVTVDLGNGSTATLHVLPGSRLLLDRAELEGLWLERLAVDAAIG